MDIVSLHIPKAAGNSVRRLLVQRYGAGFRPLYDDFRPGADYRPRLERVRDAGVVHGHVPLDLLKEAFPEARTVAWFRDPVERLLSYHFFWRQQRRHGNPNHDRYLSEGADPVLLAESLRDEVAGYLGSTKVGELDFVGVVERFPEDAARFGAWLAAEGLPTRPWRRPADRLARLRLRAERLLAPVANRNRSRGTVPPEVRAEIEEVLAGEREIYQRVLAARAAAVAASTATGAAGAGAVQRP